MPGQDEEPGAFRVAGRAIRRDLVLDASSSMVDLARDDQPEVHLPADWVVEVAGRGGRPGRHLDFRSERMTEDTYEVHWLDFQFDPFSTLTRIDVTFTPVRFDPSADPDTTTSFGWDRFDGRLAIGAVGGGHGFRTRVGGVDAIGTWTHQNGVTRLTATDEDGMQAGLLLDETDWDPQVDEGSIVIELRLTPLAWRSAVVRVRVTSR